MSKPTAAVHKKSKQKKEAQGLRYLRTYVPAEEYDYHKGECDRSTKEFLLRQNYEDDPRLDPVQY